MSMSTHWKQITPSDYAWEREALEYLREVLPDHDPYRAWSNFEFIAQDGSINEADRCCLVIHAVTKREINRKRLMLLYVAE